jgi:hypothetical protein
VELGKTLAMDKLPPFHFTYRLPAHALLDGGVFISRVMDTMAYEYLPSEVRKYVPEKLLPLSTTGDGNCLLHAASRAMFGVEMYYELLRQKLEGSLILWNIINGIPPPSKPTFGDSYIIFHTSIPCALRRTDRLT